MPAEKIDKFVAIDKLNEAASRIMNDSTQYLQAICIRMVTDKGIVIHIHVPPYGVVEMVENRENHS